jgi:DNA-binding transcriptional MocR family regulator
MNQTENEWIPEVIDKSKPIYEGIVAALRRDVHSGRLAAGAKLPTHRWLAQALGISIGTVTRAYTDAQKIGLINSERGRGVFVAHQDKLDEATYPVPSRSSTYLNLSMNQPAINYRSDILQKCFSEMSLRNDLMRLIDYTLAPGEERHYRAASAWIRFSGLEVSPDSLLLCNGAQQALFAAVSTFARPGAMIATETLNYPPLRRIADMIGVRLVGVAIDRDGMIPESLEEVCRDDNIRMIICTPRGHNPTTACLPMKRRQRILDIADHYGIPVVEDDVYGAFYGSSAPTLFEMSGGRTIYINSLSKCIAPGLRIGFLAAPQAKLPALTQPLYNTTLYTPGITSEIFVNAMNRGLIAETLEWQRRELQRRHLKASNILADFECRISPGCYHAWLMLPDHLSAERLTMSARQVGLLVTPGSVFSIADAAAPAALRLSLGRPSTIQSLERALEQLVALMAAQTEMRPMVI